MTSKLIDPLLETITEDWTSEVWLKDGEFPSTNKNGEVAPIEGQQKIVGEELEVELKRILGDYDWTTFALSHLRSRLVGMSAESLAEIDRQQNPEFDYEINGRGWHVTLSKEGNDTFLRARRTHVTPEFSPINANGEQPEQVASYYVHKDASMIEIFLNGFGDAQLVAFVTAPEDGKYGLNIDKGGATEITEDQYRSLTQLQNSRVLRSFIYKVIDQHFPAARRSQG